METIDPMGSNRVSAATSFIPLVHTEYPLAVMPSANRPQERLSGLYAVTFIVIRFT